MIPKPNLDDRTFQDIVDEALRLIPQYCPDWTNLNPSDPGVTLVELFAWMTEMMLYRLNRVPEKNLLTFLELMGVTPAPPRPATTVLTFQLNDKASQVSIASRTRVETRASAEDRPIVFETVTPLVATTTKIVAALSQHHDNYADHTASLGLDGRAFDPFGGVRAVDRFLYLTDERFGYLTGPSLLAVEFDVPGGSAYDVGRMLNWSAWDGHHWADLQAAPVEAGPNLALFEGPIGMVEREINDEKGFWVRAQLAEVPDEGKPLVLETVRARVEVRGEGILPDHLVSNPVEGLFSPLDPERTLWILGREPAIDGAFYLAAEDLFAMEDVTVKLEVEPVEATTQPRAVPSSDLELFWEFHDGKRWRTLGKAGPGVKKAVTAYGFEDGSFAMTQPGVIRFRRPKTIARTTVNGVEALWIRCRIARGDYGQAGTYELDGDRWEWRDERPLRPPVLRSLTVKFQEEDRVVGRVLSYNDFRYEDHTEAAAHETRSFEPFTIIPEANPTFYVGLDDALPHGPASVYVRAAEALDGGVRGKPGEGDRDPDELSLREQTLSWEYWSGRRWDDLPVEDGTHNLTQSGFVRFIAPTNHKASKRFGTSAHWIRARLAMGGYHDPPRLENLLLNATEAAHVITWEETVLGGSDATPNQRFAFPRGPVLDGEIIEVIEPDPPPADEQAALEALHGAEAVVADPDGGVRVRWTRVDGFFESGAADRHYVKDIVTHAIQFGDGRYGRIPPKGEKNVRARRYQVGGGHTGNVASDALQVLRKPIAYVEGVTNPYPATGGSDLEPVASVIRRGPFALKSRSRAVTAEDFEWLAREASPSVARVRCVPAREREGEVAVIVVPRVPRDHADFMAKPVPSLALLRQVKRHLNKHKLITTVLHVLKPRYVDVDIQVDVYRRAGATHERLSRAIDQTLRLFLHPLAGGRDRQGWPFGRDVYKVDLFHVIEEVRDVDLVHRVRIVEVRSGREVDYLPVAADELVFVREVEVTERSREQIV